MWNPPNDQQSTYSNLDQWLQAQNEGYIYIYIDITENEALNNGGWGFQILRQTGSKSLSIAHFMPQKRTIQMIETCSNPFKDWTWLNIKILLPNNGTSMYFNPFRAFSGLLISVDLHVVQLRLFYPFLAISKKSPQKFWYITRNHQKSP